MIIDLDSHLREEYFLDEVYKLDGKFADMTPKRIKDGEPHERRFELPWRGNDHGAKSPRTYDHTYMYDPKENWRGGEIARRQVAGYDMAFRVEGNAVEGVDKQFIFPTGISTPAMIEGELGAALATAYNNWVAKLVKGYEDKLYPVAIMPAGAPEFMAAELRRCVKDLGLKAAHLVCYHGQRNLDHPSFYPFYEAAQELDVPLFCHPNGHMGFITERFSSFFPMHVLGRPTNCTQALVALVCGGIFEKYPRLKVAFFECSAEWPLYWMHRMDDDWEWAKEVQDRHLEIPLSMEPGEYMRRNCYFTMEADEGPITQTIAEVGIEHILMATDYPHFDSEYPHTVSGIRERTDLTSKQKDMILGENAARLLNW
jgi:predicted TIM-barrel fold metal-dependent hydrolase